MSIVSVCIPTYRQPLMFKRCLDSVLEQNFQDYEIIITDDSPDKSIQEVLSAYQDVRIKYHKNDRRLGAPANWNEAMRHASSDYVKIMHHDDWFTGPDSLRAFVRTLDENPGAAMAFSESRACDANGLFRFLHKPTVDQLRELRRSPYCLFFGNFVGAPSATIFRRRSSCMFDEQLVWLVDVAFYTDVLLGGGTAVHIPQPLVSITTESENQVTKSCENNQRIELSEYIKQYKKMPLLRRLGLPYLRVIVQLCRKHQVFSRSDIRRSGVDENLPLDMRVILMLIALLKLIRSAGPASWLHHLVKQMGSRRTDAFGSNSYAQCGEDMIVAFLFKWLGIDRITYLDIGAHHPKYLSNTYYFYTQGHAGICIEPDPLLYEEIAKTRKHDLCLNVGIGAEPSLKAEYYVMSTKTLSTFSKEEAERIQAQGKQKIEKVLTIDLLTINQVLLDSGLPAPDFVSLDVEGLDFEILQSFDFSRYRPAVFCIETLSYDEHKHEIKEQALSDYMHQNGYFTYADTYINTIFVDRDIWEKRR